MKRKKAGLRNFFHRMDLIIANSLGRTQSGRLTIHSPSRWSETVMEPDRHFSYYPFFLASLSALMKRETKLTVKMMDGCLEKLSSDQYLAKILSVRPAFLFMETDSTLYRENLQLALAIKRKAGTRLLFGGPHVTHDPERALSDGIDYVFTGEYEGAVLSFFKSKKYLGTERIFYSDYSIPFSRYPWPEDEDVSRMDYAVPGEPSSQYREIQMYASRGCVGQCPFCVAKNIYYRKSGHRCRALHDVADEMAHLKKKYPQVEGFFFDEEDHFGNADFIESFCSELIRRRSGFKIEALGRFNSIRTQWLPLLKKAGYYQIRIGIESLHPEIQRAIGKIIDAEKLESFLLLCRKTGINVYGTFQVGLPSSTREKDLFTLSCIKKYLVLGWLSHVQVSIFTPLPGTPVFLQLKQKGYLATELFEDYNGGEKSVVNWPDYPSHDINRTYLDFLNIRDHVQLWMRFRTGEAWTWFYRKCRTQSLYNLGKKIKRRIYSEARYFLGRKKNQ
ncbi:MAG: radical SAM protein [Candidatus Aureabacteria bacterium]|nr:radical SAM protein [Candidatus Auribacterota bacterium]